MGYCKSLLFIITFALLCSGIFGHPFQRHFKAISPTAAATVKSVELNNLNLDYELASDESIGVQDGTNVNLTGYGDIELELLHGELEFKVCTEGCMGKTVSVCFNSDNPVPLANVDLKCGSSQCEFRGGVHTTKFQKKELWLMGDTIARQFVENEKICESATMKYPETSAFDNKKFPSCYPTKYDGNVVKLYVQTATRECPLIVIGAKKWFPPTPPPTENPELSTEKPTPSKPPPSSSTSDSSNTLWIVIGVVSGILVIALLIGLGCLIYHRCLKKKSAAVTNADGKNNQILTEVQTPTVKQETEKEKVVEEKEEKKSGVKEKVSTTKEETEEPKPKKKKVSKRKSKKQKKSKKEKKAAPPLAPKAPTPNRTKPTQEETPPNADEPAFEDTMGQSVVSQEQAAPTVPVSESKAEVKKRHPYRGNLEPRTGKLVEYNQKSINDVPSSFDQSVNAFRIPPPPIPHGLRAKAKKEKLVEYNQKSSMEKM